MSDRKMVLLGIAQLILFVLFCIGLYQMVCCLVYEEASEFIWNMVIKIIGTWICGHIFCVIERSMDYGND